MKKNHLLPLAILLLFSLIAGGCVSKGKYVELEGKLKTAQDKKQAADEACNDKVTDLQGEVAQLKDRRDALLANKRDLATANDALAEKEKARQEELRRMEENMQQMKSELEGKLEEKEAQISRIENTLKIELVDKLLFKSGSAQISRRGARLIARVAPFLKRETDKEIRIVGHTDNLPVSSGLKDRYPSNWELSCARATAILRTLQWGYKIDPRRMSAVGVAQYRPVVIRDKNTKKTRRSNRVVEIILSPLKVR